MTDIVRKSRTEERLVIKPCPICGGDIRASDCGYSSFNPGSAKCKSCKRVWDLGYVDDAWGAGKLWNEEQPKVKQRDKLEKQLKELDNE